MTENPVPTEETPKNEQQQTPAPVEAHRAHTYSDDLSRAMETSDATSIQELLALARNRETATITEAHNRHTRGWYALGGILLFLIALASGGYAYWNYRNLTVPLGTTYSVGVFPETPAVVSTTTDIRTLIGNYLSDTSLQKDKPVLINLTKDDTTLATLSNDELFSFMETPVATPFASIIQTARLGMMNTGIRTVPFVIMSVSDAEIASKELLVEEPTLIQTFYKPLAIDLSAHTTEAGKEFQSEYVYNLPVRVLRYPNTANGTNDILAIYGYVAPTTIVLTTDPAVFRGIYDTIIGQ